MNLKEKIKNRYFWAALVALIVAVVKQFNLELVPQGYEITINVVLTSLVTMGVLLDPNSPGLSDK